MIVAFVCLSDYMFLQALSFYQRWQKFSADWAICMIVLQVVDNNNNNNNNFTDPYIWENLNQKFNWN